VKRSLISFVSVALLAGCGAAPEPILVPPPPVTSASAPMPVAPSDPIGDRPAVAAQAAFVPAVPVVLEGPGGSKIWLVERHTLPLVSIAIASSVGGAADPAGQSGLSVITASMLDEGAGTRDALAFSAALEELGASIDTSADRDKSIVRLDVLAAKLPEALGLVSDAILRPRHDEKDFTRVASLWKNDLKSRGDDPSEVARVVAPAALFGVDHPYGRPIDGTLESAARVKLADVKRWHHAVWRPDRTTFVVVGDVTPEAAKELLAKAFAGFVNPKEAPPAVVMPKTAAKVPRAVIVDRADAPQVIMSVIRDGVLASNDALPRLAVLNVALGGSFTSRLNQNLREDHGWTYGARSMFVAQRGAGLFLARAAIRTDVIEPALKETLREISALAKDGLSEDETAKAKSLQRASAVETYGSLGGIARSLASNAALGLPPDQDARELGAQAAVTKAELGPLAQKYLSLDAACVVLVGPKKVAEAALKAAGIEGAELRDADGKPLGKAPAPKKRLPPRSKKAVASKVEAWPKSKEARSCRASSTSRRSTERRRASGSSLPSRPSRRRCCGRECSRISGSPTTRSST
jgi:predicted Zn-dependent peptidase